MRKKTTISILILSLFVISGLSSMISVTASTPIDLIPIDIGPKLRKSDLPLMHQYMEQYMEQEGLQEDPVIPDYPDYCEEGDYKKWAILDDYLGGYYAADFILRRRGVDCEIWVQADLSYPEKKGEHRDTPVITDKDINYLLAEFEYTIYGNTTEYFGNEDFHNGTYQSVTSLGEHYDEHGRSVILVSNVRDEAYYDASYPYYIAGFYSSSFESFFDRNIITIDSHDWENRVGDDVKRPNLYEAIIAHEYQHLIHDDWNPDDDLFMNEGCSMYAEPLCGYPLSWGDIDSFLFTPDNSLTDWGDQGDINILADYGSSFMWAMYLGDNYGPEFLSYFVKAGVPGINGINAALFQFGVTFEDVFHDWRIANLIDSGAYKYSTMNLIDTDPVRIYNLDATSNFPFKGVDFGETVTILDYATGVSMLGDYSTDYIRLDGLNNYTMSFNGNDNAIIPAWENDGKTLYSTSAGPEMDLHIRCNLTLAANSILSFDTMYEIEKNWDYGFVQISDDDGATWTSLENEYTTSDPADGAYPAIIDNLPGLTGSLKWENMEFDLTNYTDNVILQFRYMTDWASEEAGWWIENVKVNEIDLDLDDFYSITPIPEADFMVTLTNVNGSNVYDLVLDDLNYGTFDLSRFGDEYILLIVSATVGMADYELDFY